MAEGWRDSLNQPRCEPELHRRTAEAAQAADAVAELVNLHGLLAGEVMVLARTRATLGHVAQALAERGLPHVVAEPLALHESPEALDLAAVLDVLASPGHDIALARALKSPLFGASDADLLWLSRQAQGAVPWRVALLAAGAFPSSALARARALLADWVAVAAQWPPHDLLDRIVHQGDLVARLSAAVPPARRVAALQAVDALLAAALEQQGGRFITVYGFVRELRAGRLRTTGVAPSAAVRLLTVHGAKGLEARAVVVVDADPERRPAGRAMLLVDWPVERPAPRRVAFLRSEGRVPPSLTDLCAVEAAAGQREELNGLYVAMTRAREWLVFSRTEPHARGAARPWWARVEARAEPWVPAEASTPAAGADATVSVPTLPALAWRAAATVPMAPADAAAARLGQAVHRVLEWAGQPGGGLAAAELPAASAAAATAFALPAWAADRVLSIAHQVLTSPACARFFGGAALRWAGNEVPVADAGEALRIDRLVALDGGEGAAVWWVLDYKLQVGPASLPGYRAQLQRYVAAVQALQPGDVVRGAFITGQGGLVEL
jgi:ATP-dependent helicase/nuclease subunit A